MLRFLALGLKYNLSAHFSNLPNLISATVGMLLNNTLFLLGMWGMLFAGKPENQPLLFYYLALNALFMTAWGGINFFFGGWSDFGELVTSGNFESKLATPRHPLLLVSTHSLHPSALGDLVMGVVGIVILFLWGPAGMGIRTVVASFIAVTALFSVFVFAGSLAFYIPRGNLVGNVLKDLTISLSGYPMGKIFPSGLGRTALIFTPAAAVSILPMDWIEAGEPKLFGYAAIGVIVSMTFALLTYSKGVKRFQSISRIGAQF